MDAERFRAMATDGESFVMYHRYSFQRGVAFGASKRSWAVFRK